MMEELRSCNCKGQMQYLWIFTNNQIHHVSQSQWMCVQYYELCLLYMYK